MYGDTALFPWAGGPLRQITEMFPELGPCAGWDMDGELPIDMESTNYQSRHAPWRAVGPAESQLYDEDRDIDVGTVGHSVIQGRYRPLRRLPQF